MNLTTLIGIIAVLAIACGQGEVPDSNADNADQSADPAKAEPEQMTCTLEIHSATFDDTSVTAEMKKTFTESSEVTRTPDGVGIATPTVLVPSEELAGFIVGDGPLAMKLRTQTLSVVGTFMSKNSQGDQLNNAQIALHDIDGERLASGIGLNVMEARASLTHENGTEHHQFDATCITE